MNMSLTEMRNSMEEVAVEGRHEDKFHFEYVKLEIAVGLQVIR